MLLAGDIGGTHTRLAAYALGEGQSLVSWLHPDPTTVVPLAEQVFPSHDHPSLEAIVQVFVESHRLTPTHAGFGVAGPVVQGRAEVTNLPWVVDAALLARTLGIGSVALINDLEAIAYGIPALGAADLLSLNAGTSDATGNAAVIAAGTGLGAAGLYWDGVIHRPMAGEGGHVDFGPRDPLQIALLEYLLQRFPHVSYERVLSGPGLVNLYQFLRDSGRASESPAVADAMQHDDPAAVITQAALDGTDALCVQALELFCTIYGAAAGNVALQFKATGGIFIGGGIAPKIRTALQRPAFRQAFLAKGRLQDLLEVIPVQVILNEKTGLLGAARCAALQAALPRGTVT
jgi:glucokinase